MRILLIHPKINYDNMEPIGLMGLATLLSKAGYPTRVLDIFPYDTTYWLQKIKYFCPDIVGYGFESPAYSIIQKIHKILKKRYPHIVFCAGGIHTTACPEQTLKELSLDFVVLGESEISILQVIQRLSDKKPIWGINGIAYIKNDTYICNKPSDKIQDLDTLPIIKRSLLFDYPFYLLPPGNIRGLVIERTANILSSRGCPHSCIFCESKLTMGNRVRRRSVKNVIAEIQYLKEVYKIQAVYFVDDVFTSNQNWLKEFCSSLRNSNNFVFWACQSRADSLNEKIVKLMAESGCLQIDIGIESGDPNVLKSLKKKERVDTFIHAAQMIHAYKMRLLCSFLVGCPGEDKNSIRLTKNLIRVLKPSICQYFTLVPYPGSELFEIGKKEHWFTHVSYSPAVSQKQWERGFLTCGLGPKQQMKAKKELQRITFFNDHRTLVMGWFKYPQHLLGFLIVFIKHFFFIPIIVKAIMNRNPVLVMGSVYTAFNKFNLEKIRKKTNSLNVWRL